jgi:DNA-binding SARP family transcriptional activator
MLVRLLEPQVVLIDDVNHRVALTRHQQAIIAVLALSPGRRCPVGTLAGALWPDRLPDSAEKLLRTAMSRLRDRLRPHALPPDLLPMAQHGYQLNLPEGALDIERFRGLTGAARQADSSGEYDRAVDLVRQALRLWGEDPDVTLQALPDIPEVQRKARMLVQEHAEAEHMLVCLLLRLGRHDDLIPAMRIRVKACPESERAWGYLMESLVGAGRFVEAARAYHQAREALLEETGMGPGPRLKELFQAALRSGQLPARPLNTCDLAYHSNLKSLTRPL